MIPGVLFFPSCRTGFAGTIITRKPQNFRTRPVRSWPWTWQSVWPLAKRSRPAGQRALSKIFGRGRFLPFRASDLQLLERTTRYRGERFDGWHDPSLIDDDPSPSAAFLHFVGRRSHYPYQSSNTSRPQIEPTPYPQSRRTWSGEPSQMVTFKIHSSTNSAAQHGWHEVRGARTC